MNDEIRPTDEPFLPLGRVLMATLFLTTGLLKLSGFEQTKVWMQSNGVPSAGVFLVLATLVEILGGLALAIGYATRYAAALLAMYLIPVTMVFHAFWIQTGTEIEQQLILFMKNLAIEGGLAYVVTVGAGAYSVDRWLERHGMQTPSFWRHATAH